MKSTSYLALTKSLQSERIAKVAVLNYIGLSSVFCPPRQPPFSSFFLHHSSFSRPPEVMEETETAVV